MSGWNLGQARRGLVAAACAASVVAVPSASAAWEPAQRIDNPGAPYMGSFQGDVAVGGNGLATILFFQRRDDLNSSAPLVVRRDAAAATWSAPQALDTPTGFGPHVEAAADGSVRGLFSTTEGVRSLVWNAGADPAPTSLAIPAPVQGARLAADSAGNAWAVSVSEGKIQLSEYTAAAGWGAPQQIAEAGSAPDVAANDRGDVAVAYVKATASGSRVILLRRAAGETAFTASGDDQLGSTQTDQPTVVVGPDRVVTVAFRESPGGVTPSRIRAVRWLSDAGAPATPEDVSASAPIPPAGPVNDQPEAVVDPASRVTVLWREAPRSGGFNLVSAERVFGSFSDPQPVSAGDRFDLSVDAAGTATAVYLEGSGATAKINASRRATGSSWKDEATLNASGAGAGGGSIAGTNRPRVAAAAADQADVFFLQTFGSGGSAQDVAFAARFVGPPPAGPALVPAAEGCPVGNNHVEGGAGDDTLGGSAGADNVFGRAGRDVISAGGGADCVKAGDGDDDAGGQDGDDELHGEAGDDTLRGDSGADALLGGDGADLLFGSAGGDRLLGEPGVDRLSGGSGHDELDGGDDADRLFGGSGRDTLRGSAGNDLLSGAGGNDRLFGGGGDDRIRGGTGNDRMNGGDGDDRMWAGPGRDRVSGGAGADVIHVADGKPDVVRCGAGRDRVVADRFDRVVRDCERVRLSRVAGS